MRLASEAPRACAVFRQGGMKALRLTASADVGWAAVLQRKVRDTAMGLAPRRLVVAFAALHWRRCVGTSMHSRIRGRGATSAPPSPSRHDPWRLLVCVWICVIAIAKAGAVHGFASACLSRA